MARPVAVLLALVALVAASWVVAAQGGGVSPNRIDLPDAQPGQATHVAAEVQNQYPTAATFTVRRPAELGPASAWVQVDAGDSFPMAANSKKALDLTITPPDGTGPGSHAGQLNVCRAVSPTVDECYGIVLNVTVGGEARVEVAWLGAAVDDVQVGRSLLANVTARNDGNVRTTATAHAEVRPLGGGARLGQGNASVTLDPGQSGVATVVLPSDLPIGQYEVRVTSTEPAGFEATLDAKVTAEGVAPDGVLRAITNPLRVPAGEPVTVAAWFESTGDVGVAGARFVAQVLRGGEVVADLGSATVAVPAHAHANLTAVWTPAKAGAYTVVGHVEYDGFRTPDSQGRIEVGATSTLPWLWIGVGFAAFVALVVVGVVVARRRQR